MTLPTELAPRRALIVEPDAGVRRDVAELLSRRGYEVEECTSLAEGRDAWRDHAVVVTPVRGDQAEVREFVAWVQRRSDTSPWIMTGEENSPEAAPGQDPEITRLLAEAVNAALVTDREMICLAANEAWLGLFSLQEAVILGSSIYDVFPDLHEEWRALYRHCLAGHSESCAEESFQRADGTVERVRWHVRPWRRADSISGLVLECEVLPPAVEAETAEPLSPPEPVRPAEPPPGAEAPAPAESPAPAAPVATPEPAADASPFISAAHLEKNGSPQPPREDALPALPTITSRATVPDAEALLETILSKPAPSAPPADLQAELIAHAPFAMAVLNADAEVIFANDRHKAVLGMTFEECGGIAGWLSRGCLAPAGDTAARKAAVDEWWEKVWRRRVVWTCPLRNADGLIKEVEFRPVPMPGHRLLLTIADVTDARSEEQSLRASEARYRTLFQNCAAAVAVLSPAGNVTDSNPALEQLLGASRMEIRRSGMADCLPQAAMEYIMNPPTEAAPLRTSVRTRDAREVPVELSVSRVPGTSGAPAYTACFLQIIPQADAAQPAPAPAVEPPPPAVPAPELTGSGDVSAVLRHTTTAAVLTNDRGRILMLNTAAEELWGAASLHYEGSGLFRLFMPDQPKEFSQEFSGAINRTRTWARRTDLVRKDGATLSCDVEFVPWKEESTGRRGFIGLIRQAPEEAPALPPSATASAASVSLHRARNDLQILTSLSSLHADSAKSDAVREAIQEGRDRLLVLSLVYRIISSETAPVDFAKFSSDLGRQLVLNHDIRSDRVRVEAVFDSVLLPQKLAVTLGLVLEELICSALRGFHDPETRGTVRISLTTGGSEAVLIVRDSGPALTEAARTERSASFGWKVVETLTSQLNGTLTTVSDIENQVRLRFRLDQPEES